MPGIQFGFSFQKMRPRLFLNFLFISKTSVRVFLSNASQCVVSELGFVISACTVQPKEADL